MCSNYLTVTKKLSSSNYPVYLVSNAMTKQPMALKSFPFNDSQYNKEKTILSVLYHPNIIELHEAIDNIVLFDNQKISYLGLEYAANGDLLEMISRAGRLPEMLARTLFHQLIQALSYLHQQNIAHMDLKVDNVLIDDKFNLKITDFDLSQPINSVLLEGKGTPGCRAPEIKEDVCKNLRAADIYSAAIMLFVMISGSPPYSEVERDGQMEFDAFYKVMRKQNNRFWDVHSKHRGDPNFYSNEFKELFTIMTEEDPIDRATLEQIKESKWFNGPVLSEERYRQEMERYLNTANY